MRSLSCTLLLLLLGCQSVFQRDAHYRSLHEWREQSSNVVFKTSLRLAPTSAGEDAAATFSCDVVRPEDATVAGFIDATLAEAYRHARGEMRANVVAHGVKGVEESFFDDYREWFLEDASAVTNGEIAAHVACWSCHVEGRVVHCDRRYVSCRVIIDTYCGGAHPNRWIQNATFVRSGGHRLTAADVIRPDARTAVVNLIRRALYGQTAADALLHAQLRDDIRLPYDDYVRMLRDQWGNPLVTDNFMLTKDGIVWTYNQYEIGCYASGWFDARLTWRAISPHAKPEFLAFQRTEG